MAILHIIRMEEQLYVFLWFVFSSRSRHTILQGDWSSDVCSSDLDPVWRALVDDRASREKSLHRMQVRIAGRLLHEIARMNEFIPEPRIVVRVEYASHPIDRSEERRVGEECRCPWAPYPLKKENMT